jgi:hypothetical protein
VSRKGWVRWLAGQLARVLCDDHLLEGAGIIVEDSGYGKASCDYTVRGRDEMSPAEWRRFNRAAEALAARLCRIAEPQARKPKGAS